jgi:hypothetical protein
MTRTKTVELAVRLPAGIAEEAEEIQRTDPEFLSRVLLYGVTRRSICRHLREQAVSSEAGGRPAPFTGFEKPGAFFIPAGTIEGDSIAFCNAPGKILTDDEVAIPRENDALHVHRPGRAL